MQAAVIIKRGRGRSLKRRHPWIFSGAVAQVTGDPGPGDTVEVRSKGGVRLVGTATGMNSLLRPALYGAWHAIHNLSRLADPAAGYWHVVGPICETGDVLGRNRLLPETQPGDVLLVENCGAYGAVMSSSYNLRSPASEHCLEP